MKLNLWFLMLALSLTSGRSLFAEVPTDAVDSRSVTMACYYFGNYHPGEPRNEALLGPGWSEWELVRKAAPRFEGHQQPKTPAWGYENEADPLVMQRKIAAAADHGISAFIFDWYHYDDGPFLNQALDDGFLKAPNRDRLQFALMWANHDWQHIFPYRKGSPRLTLYPGKVKAETFERICDHLIHDYFLKPNYWRVGGRPYFSFYSLAKLVESFGSIEATRHALDAFRSKARDAGLAGLHLNGVLLSDEAGQGELITALGLDSVTNYGWIENVALPKLATDYSIFRDGYFSYFKRAKQQFRVPFFPVVAVGWDSSPRCDQRDVLDNSGYPFSNVVVNNTPDEFRTALKTATNELAAAEEKILLINSWNEWTEGSYLEPDTRNGMKYLEAVADLTLRSGRAPDTREELEAYLSRSITMMGLLNEAAHFDDCARMVANIRPKLIGRSVYYWGQERRIAMESERVRTRATALHRIDPDLLLQGAIFEIITQEVNSISIPAWVFEAMGEKPEARNFDYASMLYPDKRLVDHWAPGSSVPDITRPETKRWFVFLAGHYFKLGVEALHLGQIILMGENDPSLDHWWTCIQAMRQLARKEARRGFVLLDAHVSAGVDCYGMKEDPSTKRWGFVRGENLLLDFHSLPLRVKEKQGKPLKAELQRDISTPFMAEVQVASHPEAGGAIPCPTWSNWTTTATRAKGARV